MPQRTTASSTTSAADKTALVRDLDSRIADMLAESKSAYSSQKVEMGIDEIERRLRVGAAHLPPCVTRALPCPAAAAGSAFYLFIFLPNCPVSSFPLCGHPSHPPPLTSHHPPTPTRNRISQ